MFGRDAVAMVRHGESSSIAPERDGVSDTVDRRSGTAIFHRVGDDIARELAQLAQQSPITGGIWR